MPRLTRLASVIGRLSTPGTVYVERSSGVTVNDEGVAVRSSPSTFELAPTVLHPTSGRDRAVLPEGIRTSETVTLFSQSRLRTSKEAGDAADVVVHRPLGGEETRYVVQVVENWGHVSGHWRVFASREPTS